MTGALSSVAVAGHIRPKPEAFEPASDQGKPVNSSSKSTFFTVVISTRDRPDLFLSALNSVIGQSFEDKEIVIVVDGSSDENLAAYRDIESLHPAIAFHYLYHRPNGHGQSYSMNFGAQHSTGKYLCFLDDDDHWTDMAYLESVHANICACNDQVDVHYSNQKAIHSDGAEQTENVWLEDLIPRVRPEQLNHGDSYLVDMEFLLTSEGFGHLNCSIFERKFFDLIGAMDESIRYENDRDVYIRAVDAAKIILFSTRYISLHNIPDINKKNNMSTISSAIEKKLFQMRVYDKGISLAQKPATVKLCRKGKVYELKHTASILAEQKKYLSALHYAREALCSGFNLRWLAFTLYLSARALFHPGDSQQELPR